jgi:hypothetical protein
MVALMEHLGITKERDQELFGPVWDTLFANKNARNTTKFVNALMDGEAAERAKLVYYYLRFIDECVDRPVEKGEHDVRRSCLNRMNQLTFKTEPENYYELKRDLGFPADYLHRETAHNLNGSKAARKLEKQCRKLRRKEEDFAEALVERRDTHGLVRAFKAVYPQHDNLVCEFFRGMYSDLNGGGPMTDKERHKYFERIQTISVLIGLKSLGVDLEEELPESLSYGDFYRGLDDCNQALETLKCCRGKEFVEDVLELGRHYMTVDDLEQAGTNADEIEMLLNALQLTDPECADTLENDGFYQDLTAKASSVVKENVYRSCALFQRGARVIKDLPNEGALGEAKLMMAAYGMLAKEWARNLAERNFNPFDPSEGCGYADLSPGKLGKLSIYLRAKLLPHSKRIESRLYEGLMDWNFLDRERVERTLQELPRYELVGLG